MGNAEFSPATCWGMIATGLLQGSARYLLTAWFVGKNLSWTVYGVLAIAAFLSALLFSVISSKQKCLWRWLALAFIVTLGIGGWLKWQTDGMNPQRAEEVFWDFGCYLLLMAMLLLPWIQQSSCIRNDNSRYRYFYQSIWHNVLILLVISLTSGLTWLVFLPWGGLSKLVGITFFKALFFATDGSIYLTLGLVTVLVVILTRTQSHLVGSIRKSLTLIITGLLPLAPLLVLTFIIILLFTGLSMVSRHTSVAGLLLTLASLQLILMTIVLDPQKASLPWMGSLRCLIKAVLLVAPLYVLVAIWAPWLRVAQYGWIADCS